MVNGLKIVDVVGESFNDAANMLGEYRSVQRLIKDVSPNSVFMWCYSHVLNLCATDIVIVIIILRNQHGVVEPHSVLAIPSLRPEFTRRDAAVRYKLLDPGVSWTA